MNNGTKFSVKSYYSSLELVSQDPFPVKEVWGSLAPPKVGFFAWDVVWGEIMTLYQLRRRGRAMANQYCLCKRDEEATNHIHFHCGATHSLLSIILTL